MFNLVSVNERGNLRRFVPQRGRPVSDFSPSILACNLDAIFYRSINQKPHSEIT
jgi:hypothetical protein